MMARTTAILAGIAAAACGARTPAPVRPAAPACPAGTSAAVVQPTCTDYHWRDDTCGRHELLLCALRFNVTASARASICRRADGVAEGPVRGWDERGRRREHGRCAAGVPDGRWLTWHANGRRHSLTTYRRGVKHGPVRTWDERGQVRFEAEMRDGRPVGRVITRDRNGRVTGWR